MPQLCKAKPEQVNPFATSSMPAPILSAVIVSWNTKAFVTECIQSLLDTVPAGILEIIVVDNGSSDDSVDAFRQRFPNIRVFERGTNEGFARATNFGVKNATGEYVIFVNSDTKVYPGCIPELHRYMQEHPEVGMATPRIIGPDGRSQHVVGPIPNLKRGLLAAVGFSPARCPCCRDATESIPDKGLPEDVDLIMLCFAIVRRSAIADVGLLDENFFMYGEDVDYSKRFRDKGWRLVFLPSARTFHYGGGSSERAPVRFYLELLRARMQYFQKHNGRLGAIACRMILILHMLVRLLAYSPAAVLEGPVGKDSYRAKVHRSWSALVWLIAGGSTDRA